MTGSKPEPRESGAEVAEPSRGHQWLKSLWWRWGIGLVLLAALVVAAGPGNLIATLSRVSPAWALSVVPLACCWFFIGGFKISLLLRCLSASHRLGTFLVIYVVAWTTSLVIPGQLGDSTQVILLRRHGIPVGTSGAAYLVDKAGSLAWMLLVGAYGITLYLPQAQGWWLMALPAALALGTAVAVGLVRTIPARPGGLIARFRAFVDQLLHQLWTFRKHPETLLLNLFLTVVKWMMMGLVFFCSFRAFGFSLDFVPAATIPVMSSLVGYIPITVGGAGTMEWTAVILYGQLHVEAATVVSTFFFQKCVSILVALIVIFAFGKQIIRERMRGERGARPASALSLNLCSRQE